ncbi:DUF3429 domain-containing protein [Alteromonas sp. CYL-A6]|uniref:DUF3429 domain-containing protein n=1 Tax=Alteromonas nitratireducens TaxID=3390813 RepID=UPI0034C49A2C
MPYSAVFLGLAGLLPFLCMPLAIVTDTLPLPQAARYFTQYSAVLLSFFGGIHWWDAISHKRFNHQMVVAMLPTITGWLCLVFSGTPLVLGILSISYLAILFYDKYMLALPKSDIMSYMTLRMGLTTVVVLTHAWMIALLT